MNVMIMGCGRVGARVAGMLDEAGHDVTVLDITSAAFKRLPEGFRGKRAVGNGIDGPVLERSGIREMDAFMATTQGDNRNFFASMMAKEVYGVKRVLCRFYDPVREQIFHDLGLETFSPTSIGAQIMFDMLTKNAAPGR
jgi:trk system potassium uptake protein